MRNRFIKQNLDKVSVQERIRALRHAKVGFYSIGPYPGSLIYNIVMQAEAPSLLLAVRPGRELMGAFPKEVLQGMDQDCLVKMHRLAHHEDKEEWVPNTLEDLVANCDLVMLCANSSHIATDLEAARRLRRKLSRNAVVLGCLNGSFNHNQATNEADILCNQHPNLAFLTGFHRHDALRDPIDSFTANFCHPNALTALFGAHMLNQLSPNIQVSPGVHNVEAQYTKAAKNIASMFAGFGHEFYRHYPGILPTLLTLLHHQCLDQAATVSMARRDRHRLYDHQTIDLTELGYGVPRIEANLDGTAGKSRDHTFSQLMAMVADVQGSMMYPPAGQPTRNFQAGQVLANLMRSQQRCPANPEEFERWCENAGLRKSSLEGLKALRYWPQIAAKYQIQVYDASLNNLLYIALFGTEQEKQFAYDVMTASRELSNYCQESVRPTHSRKYVGALNSLDKPESVELLVNAVIADHANQATHNGHNLAKNLEQKNVPAYRQVMSGIESGW